MAKKIENDEPFAINEVSTITVDFYLVGTSPLVPHAMSSKSAVDLLAGGSKKTAAEKAMTIKHEPWDEFREAAYVFTNGDDTPTRLYMPGSAFHSALAAVAIDMAGAKKAQIARLTSVLVGKIPVWGIPDIWCTVVRSSDMNRTPDVRTLPHLSRWAAKVPITFVDSLIKPQSIVSLFGNAGIIVGIGDGRPQKGKLSKGCWRLCGADDPEFMAITKQQGRKAQDAALADPKFADIETRRMLEGFNEELKRRSAQPVRMPKAKAKTKTAMPPPKRGRGNGRNISTQQGE